jgi:hypothetical protein
MERDKSMMRALVDSVSAEAHIGAQHWTKLKFNVFCGTWNCNARAPKESLEDWLCKTPEGKIMYPSPDIYAIGLEEVIGLHALNVIGPARSSHPWEKRILECLGSEHDLLATEQIVGLLLLVFVKKKCLPYCSMLRTDQKGCGFLGVGGNKGGVAISFNLYETSFVFVAAHLAAHQNKIKQRNNDYATVESSIHFRKSLLDTAGY